jgi:PAS domain S-box-containing protein
MPKGKNITRHLFASLSGPRPAIGTRLLTFIQHPVSSIQYRFFLLTSIFFLIIFLTPPCPATAQTIVPGRAPNVLILNSYHHGYDWSEKETGGLLEKLQKAYPEINIFIEYLDAKRFPDPRNLALVNDYLTKKYMRLIPDLVIALDNPALDLILTSGGGLFKNVPVVFTGINNYTPEMLRGRKGITGVAEVLDITGTLRTALAFHPNCREVFVMHDYTVTGLAVRKEVEAQLSDFQGRCPIIFNPPATFEENIERMKRLPAGSIGLILSFITDRTGKNLPPSQGTRLLTSVDSVPVYALHETRLGNGIVGGMLLGGTDHGAKAGEIALRILKGEDPDRISVFTESTSRPMFDYRQLEHFKISIKSLPPGSRIINRPVSFFEKNKTLIIATLAVIGALMLVIFVLTANIIRRRRTEKALLESETRLKAMINSSQDPILTISPDRLILSVNPAFKNLYGYRSEEAIGQSVALLHVDEEAFQRFGEKIYPIIVKEGFWTGEWKFKSHGGRIIPIELTMSYLQSPDGKKMGYLAIHRDISERKRAEEELKEGEERYRTTLMSVGDGVIATDALGRIKLMNPVAETLTGWNQEEAEGRALPEVFRIINEETRNPVDNPASRVIQKGAVVGLANHTLLIDREGREYPIADSGAPILNAQGAIMGVVLVFRDQTEEREAQEILKSQHKVLEKIIQSAPYILVLVNQEVRVENINYAGEVFTGQPREKMLGLLGGEVFRCFNSFDGLGCGRNADCQTCPIRTRVRHTFQTGEPLYEQEGQLTVVDEGGQKITLELLISTAPVKMEGSEKVLVTVVDVTKRKKMEEELRASEEKFFMAFQHAPLLMTISSLEDGTYLEVNDQFAKISGFSRQETIGKTSVELGWLDPGDRTRLIEILKKDGRVSDLELTLLTKDKRRVVCNYHGELITIRGKVRLLSLASDITLRKEMEIKIRQSLKEKELLLKEVHHRVKNNLQVISSLLNLQARFAKDTQAVEVLRESQNRLRTMAFIHSKLYQAPDLATVNWTDYLSDLVGELFRSYKTAGGGVDLKIEADQILLDLETAVPCGLIINELVSNALKYAFPNQESWLMPERYGRKEIIVQMQAKEKTMVLTVSDNGIGLPPGLDFGRTESLGLQLVVTLAEQLAGSIRQLEGTGTGFEITFPVFG